MRTKGLLALTLLVVMLFVSFSALADDPIEFGPTDGYTVSAGGSRMVTGDFNGDGWEDMVLVDGFIFFGVLLNQGDGTFSPSSYSTSFNIVDVAVVNLAGDADPDLVLFNYDGTAQIYSGDGLGGFVNTDTITMSCGVLREWNRVWPVVGDFNRDGLADVALDCQLAISLALGNSSGGLDPQTPLSNVSGRTLAVGLIDADTIADLVTIEGDENGYRNIVTMAGDGLGGFVRAKATVTDFSYHGYDPESYPTSALGDLNGDGINDLVIANVYYNPSSRNLQVWFGDGTGGFARGLSFNLGYQLGEVKLVDANGDGKLDILVAAQGAPPGLSVILSYGNGTFSPVYSFFSSLTASSAAVADFNHQGPPDLAVSLSDGMLHVLFGVTVDRDHDLLSDADENLAGTDPDDPDTDGDGMPDGWEVQFGLDPLVNDVAGDVDVDGLSNLDEYRLGTNPHNGDSDGDNMDDAYEVAHPCLRPGVDDGEADPDQDDLTNADEYILGADPCAFTDTDGDGMPDGWELKYSGWEFLSFGCGLNPYVNDAHVHGDGDCFDNLAEYQNGTDPCTANYAVGPVEFRYEYNCYDPMARRQAVADFNNDGYPDLAAVDEHGGYLIAMNNGDETFTFSGYPLGTFPQDVAVIFLPGDAYPDLVISDAFAQSVYVLAGNGDGTFTLNATVPAGTGPYGLAAADLNSDGITDIIAGLAAINRVGVFLGNGSGGFGPISTYHAGEYCMEVAVGIINSDGFPDVVAACGTSVVVLLGNGAGGLGAPSATNLHYPYLVHIAIGDLDQDGKLDVVAGAGYDVHLFFGDGQGGWRRDQGLHVDTEIGQVRLADLNGNGFLDVVLASTGNNNPYPGRLWLLLNHGYGVFQTYAIQGQPFYQTYGIAAADFNRDGTMDLVPARCLNFVWGVPTDSDGDLLSDADEAICGTDPHDPDSDGDENPDGWEQSHAPCGLSPLVNDAGANPDFDCLDNWTEYREGTDPCTAALLQDPIAFGPPETYAPLSSAPTKIIAVDFNQDGDQDLLAAYSDGAVATYLNDGDGTFTNVSTGGAGVTDIGVTELNGDNFPDLVVTAYDSGLVFWFYGRGDGNADYAGYLSVGSNPTALALGDLNGDGQDDLAVCRESGTPNLLVLLGEPGGFGTPAGYSLVDGCRAVAIARLDGDANADVIVAGASSLAVLAGDGLGGLGTPHSIPTLTSVKGLDLGDFNEDGKLDVAVFTGSEIEIMQGNGQGGFIPYRVFAAGNHLQQVRMTDLNGDGHLDLMASRQVDNGSGNGLTIYPSYGHGSVGPPIQLLTNYTVFGLAAADFNRDGVMDLAYGGGNSLQVMLGIDRDADTDVLSNLDEGYCGLDDDDRDSDGDGMPDGWEVFSLACGLDPNTADALGDTDLDGLDNLSEYQLGTNPCLADTDLDGLSDGEEHYVTGTCPTNADTDFDGVSDRDELQAGAVPTNSAITPRAVSPAGEVRLTTSGHAADPYLIWTGSEYALAYSAIQAGDDAAEIYFQRLSVAGAPLGAAVRVTSAVNRSAAPVLAWTGSEYGLAWLDLRDEVYPDWCSEDCRMEVYFTRLSANGAKLTPDVLIFDAAWDGRHDDSFYRPTLAWNGNEYGLGWRYLGSGNAPENLIYFTRVSAAGVEQGPRRVVTSLGSRASLAWTGSEYGLGWSRDEFPYQARFVRVSAAGTRIGADLGLVQGTLLLDPSFGVFTFLSSLAWTGSEFGLGWADIGSSLQYRLGLARISPQGEVLSDEPVYFPSGFSFSDPVLAWTGREFGLAFTLPFGDSGNNIYLVQVSAAGAVLGAPVPMTYSSSYKNQFSLASTGSEYGLAWQDHLEGVYEIHFTLVALDSDGDGLLDREEGTQGTNPLDWDTDNDGVSDGDELNVYLTDPVSDDTDRDGLKDGEEINPYHTNPLSWDSDSDRMPDGFEAVNSTHAGGGLDPLNALDGPMDFDGDGNSNANEYWNGSDPWTIDPTPGEFENPGCYYWADADGDGNPAPSDLVLLKLQIAGAAQEYRDILPHGIDTLDLDRDGNAAPSDQVLLKLIVALSERPGGYPSQALALETVDAPSGSVAVGSTTHVTVSVHSVSGAPAFAPGFGVVFTVDSGNAVLLGGDGTANGEAAGNRYDFSMEAAAGARANVVVLVTGSGAITIGAKIPECGTAPIGRWNDEVVLSPEVVINP
jgi:hypothetical protein